MSQHSCSLPNSHPSAIVAYPHEIPHQNETKRGILSEQSVRYAGQSLGIVGYKSKHNNKSKNHYSREIYGTDQYIVSNNTPKILHHPIFNWLRKPKFNSIRHFLSFLPQPWRNCARSSFFLSNFCKKNLIGIILFFNALDIIWANNCSKCSMATICRIHTKHKTHSYKIILIFKWIW